MIDFTWEEKIINPSRCALLKTDQWGTVSKSYWSEIRQASSLSSLLNRFVKPFAFPNGVDKSVKLK